MLDYIQNHAIFNNTLLDYIISFGIFSLSFLIFLLINKYLLHTINKKISTKKIVWGKFLITFLKEIKLSLYFILSLFIGFQSINVHPIIYMLTYYLLLICVGFYLAKGMSQIIDKIIQKKVSKINTKESNESKSMFKVLGLILKGSIWLILLLMILSNAGLEITPLIAGMGIAGIAIALGLQTILSDLFCAFVIYFDKPFKEGDFIIIGPDMGVVKNIGVKSTRIQALQGQELIMSNTELVNSRVNNYKQMEKRRISFDFGVKYNTGKAKLEKIKSIVKKTFKEVGGADLDRVHFKNFGAYSLNFEVVYYVGTADYNKYMDTQEEINMKIYSYFELEKIEFAFPTQTIDIQK